jgi:WD40 repeat protein
VFLYNKNEILEHLVGKEHMPIKIFFCYAHEDEKLLNQLMIHLKPLERQGLIELWYDHAINAGAVWASEISQHLKAAQIILLLISPDFINSEYCWETELKQALERHKQGEVRVLPVILRHVYWQGMLGHLQALPKEGLPITDPGWYHQDRALYNVTEGLCNVIADLALSLSAQEKAKGELQLSNPLRRRWSRRTILLAGTMLIGGGISWFSINSALLKPVHLHPTAKPTPPGTTLLRYTEHTSSWVFSIAWSPKSNTLASASQDHTVHVWDASTGDDLLPPYWHAGPVYSVKWSPDGNRLASASEDHTVHVWDASTGKRLLLPYKGHSQAVWSVAWSPDGNRLASASQDQTAQVWDAHTGDRLLAPYKGHTEPVYSIAWSPDGNWLASAGNDRTVQIWGANTGIKRIPPYKGHTGPVYSIAWSPDGNWLASAGYDQTVRIWDASTGNHLLTYEGHSDAVRSVAWSPDGKLLASASYDGTVQIWNASSKKQYLIYTDHYAQADSVVWPPHSQKLASAHVDHTVRVWEGFTV